jgi:hypothetical protein
VDHEGDLYTINGYPGHVQKFGPTGIPFGEVTPNYNYQAMGMGIDPVTNTLYVVGEEGTIRRYVFGEAPNQVVEQGAENCSMEQYGEGCKATSLFAENVPGATGVAFDRSTHDAYVDLGSKIVQLDSTGARVDTTFSGTPVSKSTGIAVDGSGNIFATDIGSNHADVVEYGNQPPPFHPIDDPAVLDAVAESGARHTADFQVSPDGRFAAYPSAGSLSGYDNHGHTEVFRFDAESGNNVCVSCASTGARATADAGLAVNGLSLTADGKVFFNSSDPIAPRDLDGIEDAYEWEPRGAGPSQSTCGESKLDYDQASEGCLDLISTGTSSFASSLLGVSENGTDAYFFTRDALVPQDQNGHLVKIYDAREAGGFPYVEPAGACKASDECHGPGSEKPGPTGIDTKTGTGGNETGEKQTCKRGYVLRHGNCVKKRKPHHHHKRHKKNHGGRK